MDASLSPLGRAMLDLETATPTMRRWAKENEIRQTFGLTPTRYYQLLLTLIERPEALAYAPAVVNRLHGQIDAQRARRRSREDALTRAHAVRTARKVTA